MDYTKKYKRIVDSLIKKSFPELRDKKLFVTETSEVKERYSAMVIKLLIFSWIRVNKRCRKYSNKAVMALFAHELAHQDIIKRMNFSEMISYFWLWPFSWRRRADFENRTDKLVIEKGYARGLSALVKESFIGKSKKFIEHRRKMRYLFPEEIKSYAKKIGKW